ncbi:MAG TPA: NifB/NifX family molybdenum-iron cluster-binding protein [Syntrophales bacterium]|nr:NifB/NifX family molybdenum-iron cluster-binding protein [Syntrophales bacterium]HOM06264.1 NifB/NifX family molybdenum-iron cluster-binding protein [Syntrophales bacterium]HON99296.1 NifB/NifX family molybdenum-iron cluster-binding protein [Syntrophales bacterium]HPC00121.1 NifB/NifX family molybdenum-iron cluster-binding protein [Syntrophales bacterium]HPQ05754.1 NifB/NifX family molybdenum-iron cluster-binding protein [Syntrophales bacterium]
MKIALSVWKDRISTVFDAADQVLIVETDGGGNIGTRTVRIQEGDPTLRAKRIADLGVEALVCGAISRQQMGAIAALGVGVIPFVRGEVREVVRAYVNGDLQKDEYALPGCRGRNTMIRCGRGRCRRHGGRGGTT